MADVTKDRLFERAVDLIINADHVSGTWITCYVSVQGGLGVAAGAILAFSTKSNTLKEIAGIFLSLIGVIFGFAIVAILRRNAAWQRHFKAVARAAQDPSLVPILFEEGAVDREERAPYSEPSVQRSIQRANVAVAVTWACFALYMLLALFGCIQLP
jgi:hypothetical protein